MRCTASCCCTPAASTPRSCSSGSRMSTTPRSWRCASTSGSPRTTSRRSSRRPPTWVRWRAWSSTRARSSRSTTWPRPSGPTPATRAATRCSRRSAGRSSPSSRWTRPVVTAATPSRTGAPARATTRCALRPPSPRSPRSSRSSRRCASGRWAATRRSPTRTSTASPCRPAWSVRTRSTTTSGDGRAREGSSRTSPRPFRMTSSS